MGSLVPSKKRVVELMEYTPMYKQFYLKECKVLEKILRSNLIDVHHIGSTAIPKILAKPTLDIMCVVHTLDGIAVFKDEFEKLGLIFKGENGMENRLYFVRLAKDGITHLSHIHIFEKFDERIEEHLLFRDRLNQDESLAKKYEAKKIELKDMYGDDPAKYTEEKGAFIKILASAFATALD
ncbi:hypothetical protein A9Q84_03325 [Halobacteriovorax marinus]|uniref:GrpB family protein n=1 Tax=Halobacteriovorax marinus TaxID=97084 RepID=A0A1Y5FH12_9BACT|nr:hypothetical protein A9Q84_03325 [Halobacteriovorax marinus]